MGPNISVATLQRLKPVQHVVREDLDDGANLGDEVTSLCGEKYRMRYKDNPNFLTCGMCALLLVREYRGLLTDHNRNVDMLNLVVDAIDNAEAEQAEEQDEEPAPDETEPPTGDGEGEEGNE